MVRYPSSRASHCDWNSLRDRVCYRFRGQFNFPTVPTNHIYIPRVGFSPMELWADLHSTEIDAPSADLPRQLPKNECSIIVRQLIKLANLRGK